MTKPSHTQLLALNEFISTHMGLTFLPNRLCDLERGIISAAPEFDFSDAGQCIDWLLSSLPTRKQIDVLSSRLTIGETYFFREPRSFRILSEHILPQLVQARSADERRVRIWSAGCCTGEEAYSLAIALKQAIPDIERWDVTILATDINSRFLHLASQGIYGEWSFRDVPDTFKMRYFTRLASGRYALADNIKRLVTFSYLNLAEDIYPSHSNNTQAMDVIFCRNVLIYLHPQKAAELAKNLSNCLNDDGWLFVGATETSNALFSHLASKSFHGVTVYQNKKTEATIPQYVHLIPDPFEIISKTFTPGVVIEDDTESLLSKQPLETAPENLGVAAVPPLPDLEEQIHLARACANQGDLAAALTWCERALVANKMEPRLHYLLATVLQEYGRLPEAAAALKKSLYLRADFIMAHFALGNLVLQLHERDMSQKHFKQALRLLHDYDTEEVVPESDGLTAGRLKQIIDSITELEYAR